MASMSKEDFQTLLSARGTVDLAVLGIDTITTDTPFAFGRETILNGLGQEGSGGTTITYTGADLTRGLFEFEAFAGYGPQTSAIRNVKIVSPGLGIKSPDNLECNRITIENVSFDCDKAPIRIKPTLATQFGYQITIRSCTFTNPRSACQLQLRMGTIENNRWIFGVTENFVGDALLDLTGDHSTGRLINNWWETACPVPIFKITGTGTTDQSASNWTLEDNWFEDQPTGGGPLFDITNTLLHIDELTGYAEHKSTVGQYSKIYYDTMMAVSLGTGQPCAVSAAFDIHATSYLRRRPVMFLGYVGVGG